LKSQRKEWACGEQGLQPHQQVVIEMVRMISMMKSGPMTPRGLLIYHGTGHGKTVMAMGIAALYWNKAKGIFFVTTDGNRKDNPPSEYAKNTLLFFPEYAEEIFAGARLPPRHLWTPTHYEQGTEFSDELNEGMGTSQTLDMWCRTIGATLIQKKMKFLSFVNFSAEKGSVPIHQLKNEGPWVVIVDEAQNLFKIPREMEREKEGLRTMRKFMTQEQYMEHSKFFALTATPGEDAHTVLNLVNMVRPYGQAPITPQDFIKKPALIGGLVSHADIRGDQSRYGYIQHSKPMNLKIPHTPQYYAAMLQEMDRKKQSEQRQFKEGEHVKFFKDSREMSIMMPESQVAAMYPGSKLPTSVMMATTPQKGNPSGNQFVLSKKTETMVNEIQRISGCQYVYGYNQKVVKALGTVFHKLGYEIINLVDMDANVSVAQYFKTPKPRILLHHEGNMIYPDGTHGTQQHLLNPVMAFFRSKQNKDGRFIKVVIGTKVEGLNMKHLRAVHLLAPLPTVADDDQAVGRALRLCGHEPDQRSVHVYRYWGMPPADKALTSELRHLAQNKQEEIQKLHKLALEKYPFGRNVHVHMDAVRRGTPLQKFMNCIKAHSIECVKDSERRHHHVLAPVHFGDPVQCGLQQCDVLLNEKGALTVPEKVDAHIVEKLGLQQERNNHMKRLRKSNNSAKYSPMGSSMSTSMSSKPLPSLSNISMTESIGSPESSLERLNKHTRHGVPHSLERRVKELERRLERRHNGKVHNSFGSMGSFGSRGTSFGSRGTSTYRSGLHKPMRRIHENSPYELNDIYISRFDPRFRR
jgi:hypothetical protein